MKDELKNTRCKVCGRRLKSEESIKMGMGKTCQRKYLTGHKVLFDVNRKEESQSNEV